MRFMMLMIPLGYETAPPDVELDPERVAAMMKYNQSLKDAGVLITLDGLHPPSVGARVSFATGKPVVTDGPFAESKEVLGGYWMIDVASREEAIEWASKCPASESEIIEIRRVQEMSDFSEEVQKAAAGLDQFERPAVRPSPSSARENNPMSTNDTFLAVFLGSKTTAKMAAWNALPETERRAREQQGVAAWHAWVEKHQADLVALGGPLGKTKKADSSGIADISNEMSAFSVVRAASHEAAAKMFENHPHFAIFPGERVEIMPVLPIPGR